MRTVPLLLLLLCATCDSTRIDHPEFVHLLGGESGSVYGQAADGSVYGGRALTERTAGIDGATSMSGGRGTGADSLGGGVSSLTADFWQCAVVGGMVLCAGKDDDNSLGGIEAGVRCQGGVDGVPIPPNSVPQCNDGGASANCYGCVPDWTAIPNISGAVQVNRSCALLNTGVVTCWAGFTAVQIPAPVARLGGMFAITADGDLYSLLDGSQVGIHNVIRADSDYSVQPDVSTACAVTSSSDLYCWGNNDVGQVGDGTTIARPVPTLIGTGFTDVRIATGIGCGLLSDGEVECWGMAARSLTPAKIGIDNAVEIADISYVLLGDGRVMSIAWGPGALVSQLYPPI